jgi:intracellular sulfur oxidation DsrE/DsrF family protein
MIGQHSTHRRGFLGRAAALAAGAVATPKLLEATSLPAEDEWLNRITGSHRQLFDAPADAGGLPMVHILNYLNTYNTAYGVMDSDINVIGTFYGFTTLHGLNDATWAKYRLGEIVNVRDGSGQPATANPWRTQVTALGTTFPGASIEALQKRGVIFLLCNNALTFFSGTVAKGRGLDQPAVYADLKANMLPGVVLVPAMVIAIEKAQTVKNVAYNKQ